jgi:hypothetical protein
MFFPPWLFSKQASKNQQNASILLYLWMPPCSGKGKYFFSPVRIHEIHLFFAMF